MISPSPGKPGEGRGEGLHSIVNCNRKSKSPHPNLLPEYREKGPEEKLAAAHRSPAHGLVGLSDVPPRKVESSNGLAL
jgi:hypothetical protein